MKKALLKTGKLGLERRGKIAGRFAQAFPVVGIGASAGGLKAMTQLLKHLPARTGMAFVLVQHLDPTHESALAARWLALKGGQQHLSC